MIDEDVKEKAAQWIETAIHGITTHLNPKTLERASDWLLAFEPMRRLAEVNHACSQWKDRVDAFLKTVPHSTPQEIRLQGDHLPLPVLVAAMRRCEDLRGLIVQSGEVPKDRFDLYENWLITRWHSAKDRPPNAK